MTQHAGHSILVTSDDVGIKQKKTTKNHCTKLTYTANDDYPISNIALTEAATKKIGKYGRIRRCSLDSNEKTDSLQAVGKAAAPALIWLAQLLRSYRTGRFNGAEPVAHRIRPCLKNKSCTNGYDLVNY